MKFENSRGYVVGCLEVRVWRFNCRQKKWYEINEDVGVSEKNGGEIEENESKNEKKEVNVTVQSDVSLMTFVN